MRAIAYFLLGLALSLLAAAMLLLRNSSNPATTAAPVELFGLISGFQCHAAETRHVFFSSQDERVSAETPSDPQPLVQISPPVLTAEGFVLVETGAGAAPERIVFQLSDGQRESARTASASGWTVEAGYLHARMSQLLVDSPAQPQGQSAARSRIEALPGSLLHHIRTGGGELTIDMLADAALSIGQAAVVLCEEPPSSMGLAMSTIVVEADLPSPVTMIGCHYERGDLPQCDPLRGNAPCDAPLPLLCFRDLDASAPDTVSASFPYAHLYEFYWSGGHIAATGEIRGDALATIRDANALCENELGAGWRVASYHEAARSNNFVAYGALNEPFRFHWLDIKDQPYATCWRR